MSYRINKISDLRFLIAGLEDVCKDGTFTVEIGCIYIRYNIPKLDLDATRDLEETKIEELIQIGKESYLGDKK